MVVDTMNYGQEPLEVLMLKHQLANLKCMCRLCERNPYTTDGSKLEFQERSIQVSRESVSFQQPAYYRFSYPDASTISLLEKSHNRHAANTVHSFCPTCFVAFRIMNRSVHKVLKDEESGTNYMVPCCDKSTDKRTDCVTRTTSFNSDPGAKYSNLTFCDVDSQGSNDLADSSRCKKHNLEKVTFLDDYLYEMPEGECLPSADHCFCLESFIDSIRPPLK